MDSTHLSELKQDPRNARRHSARNLAAIETSIAETGFGRPMLAANDGTLIAGNLTSEALANLGMEDVIVVRSDGTRPIVHIREDIEPGDERAIKAGLYDNLASDLADGYDPVVLAALLEEVELSPVLLTTDEAAALLTHAQESGANERVVPDDYVSQWMVLVECDGEDDQLALLERFLAEGLPCRALTS